AQGGQPAYADVPTPPIRPQYEPRQDVPFRPAAQPTRPAYSDTPAAPIRPAYEPRQEVPFRPAAFASAAARPTFGRRGV
ncbi:MAG: hypothetical protein JWM33_3451, partial [Caulobacteraceae bacterium]|nr:hypothetical protein [Caulobacteraceae bacterium]